MISGTILLLILHSLVGVALLGAITHQLVSMLRRRKVPARGFIDRYSGVNQQVFVAAVMALYVAQVILGAIVYPSYRLNVRIPFEEMFLFKAVGSFETKEHFAGIGLGLLPLYYFLWRPDAGEARARDRLGITALLAFIVWYDFLIGHILNNLRGL
jgi:hypothetical protein